MTADWLLQCLCSFSCSCWNWLLQKGSEEKWCHICSQHTFWGGRRTCHFPEVHPVSMHWASSSEVRKQASILQESGKFPACRNTVRCFLLFMSKEWIFYSVKVSVDLWSGLCQPRCCGSLQGDPDETRPTPNQGPAGSPAGPPAGRPAETR